MEHDFSVCSTGKFPEIVKLLKRVVPFSGWKFSDGTTCFIYGFRKVYQFQGAHDHIFGKEIWRQLPQLARWLPSPPLSTNAQLSWPGS